MSQIQFHNVWKRFSNGFDALRDISVAFERGSMTFLTGHSGAGKSTFLKLLLCLDRPTRGQILVNGVNLRALKGKRLSYYRQNLGAVFQDHNLLTSRTVFENVALPLRVIGLGGRDVRRRVRAALTQVGLLERESLLPAQLSTGEQQRVGIARAVVIRPRVLIADEPTGNLDPQLSQDIMSLFQKFNQVGATVIVASHDIGLISSQGKRIIELSQGALVRDIAASPRGAVRG